LYSALSETVKKAIKENLVSFVSALIIYINHACN
jgi:hypothetical protein